MRWRVNRSWGGEEAPPSLERELGGRLAWRFGWARRLIEPLLACTKGNVAREGKVPSKGRETGDG